MNTNKNVRLAIFTVLATISMLVSSCKSQPNDGLFTGRDKLVRILDNVSLGQTCEAVGGYVQNGVCYAK